MKDLRTESDPGVGGALEPRCRIWLECPGTEAVFGDGKWRLLEAIEREGSLQAAAKTLEISYRKAWGDLHKAERCLGVVLLERHRGGAGGGETHLTGAGKAWAREYARLRKSMERALRAEMDILKKRMASMEFTEGKT